MHILIFTIQQICSKVKKTINLVLSRGPSRNKCALHSLCASLIISILIFFCLFTVRLTLRLQRQNKAWDAGPTFHLIMGRISSTMELMGYFTRKWRIRGGTLHSWKGKSKPTCRQIALLLLANQMNYTAALIDWKHDRIVISDTIWPTF